MSTSRPQGENGKNLDDTATSMFHAVRRDREKKEAYRRRGDQSVWSAMGMMGMVGWGIILPAVLGGFLGRYLDGKFGTRHDMAILLALVGLGLVTGVLSGLFGVGGAFLLNPLLIVVLGMNQSVVVGSGLSFAVGTAAAGMWRHRRAPRRRRTRRNRSGDAEGDQSD